MKKVGIINSNKVAMINVNRTQLFEGRVIDISTTAGRFPNIEAAKIWFEFFKDDLTKIDGNTVSVNVTAIEGRNITQIVMSGANRTEILFQYSTDSDKEKPTIEEKK